MSATPQPANLPLHAGCHTLTFGDVALTIAPPPDFDALLDACVRETPDDVDRIPYYANLWPAAIGLAEALVARAGDLTDTAVAELGCGLALPAILAARLGAAPVVATDFHHAVAPWLRLNAMHNDAIVTFVQLDWDTPEKLGGERFDWVIGSDLLYEQRHIPALVRCIGALAAPGATLLFADPGRDGLGLFSAMLARAGWRCELEPHGEIYVITAVR